MFYGGLNGDGFFNEEYSDGGYEDGEGCPYGYVAPTNTKDLLMVATGKETEKAVQYRVRDMVTVWMPKKALTKPHFLGVESWGITILHNNMKAEMKGLQDEAKRAYGKSRFECREC